MTRTGVRATDEGARLRAWFAENLPVYSHGIELAREENLERFDRLADQFLGWAGAVLGPDYLSIVARSYAQFTTSVNYHQLRYEAKGCYEAGAHEECKQNLYAQDDRMTEYLWGVYLTFFLWPHHLRLGQEFEDHFLPYLKSGSKIAELGCGHGGWGCWALSSSSGTTLRASDLSAQSIRLATQLSDAAGLSARAEYLLEDALVLSSEPWADAALCGFLVEHLDQPPRLFQALASHVKPGGMAFVTGALTAAQEDHVYEFVRESELLVMAEEAGFRVLKSRSEGPDQISRKSRYLPRSMSLILQRRANEFW